ncbi:MAG: hypothetical protein OEX03_07215 [Gammaproteobacteria bacterium]|nr:hypothetical protein [Gammaproteobacteria bacterium]
MIDFLQNPGPRERQLQRAYNNPLFLNNEIPSPQQVELARQLDAADLESFIHQFQTDIEAAVNLKPQADADDVLALKARMETLYTQACGIQGERSKFKTALKQLMEIISRSLVTAANNDPEAMQKINDDMEATELHLRISESLLAADIINPNEIIDAGQLASSMLCSSEEELASALLIFDPEQLQLIVTQASQILEQGQKYINSREPELRFKQMHQWLSAMAQK